MRTRALACIAVATAFGLLTSCYPKEPDSGSSGASSRTSYSVTASVVTNAATWDETTGSDASQSEPNLSSDTAGSGSQVSADSHASASGTAGASGHASGTAHGSTTRTAARTTVRTAATTKKEGTAPPAATVQVKTPVASGTAAYSGSGVTVDASHAAEGYVMVKCSGTATRLKVDVLFGTEHTYYDLNAAGRYEVFPLQQNGAYRIRVMEEVVSGSGRYRQRFAAEVTVTLHNAFLPYLYPNQYAWFTASSATVKKSGELCAGKTTDLQKIQAVYDFLRTTITYDKVKAQTVQKGYLPDVDEILRLKKGICFDYAAVLTAMLRAQGIPTKLVVGTVTPNDASHAWNLVYTQEKGWITLGPYFDGKSWKLMDATFAAALGDDVQSYIGDGQRYTELRVY